MKRLKKVAPHIAVSVTGFLLCYLGWRIMTPTTLMEAAFLIILGCTLAIGGAAAASVEWRE